MQNILVLGGSLFVGRVLVEQLVATGYTPTLFNRGKTNPDLFPELARITGDRESAEIAQLAGQDWDIVFDLCGYFPNSLEKLLDTLKGRIGRYVFVSSASAFDIGKYLQSGLAIRDEFETLPCTDAEKLDGSMATYGQRKAECERVLLVRDWLDAVILRPALIYGSYDPTDRMYYWLQRSAVNKRILMPEDGVRTTALTYVDDLARAMLACIDVPRHRKVYNAATHPPVSFRDIVNTATAQVGSQPELIGIPGDFLVAQGVGQWVEMPLWINGCDFHFDSRLLFADLLTRQTSLAAGIAASIAHYEPRNWETGRYGMPPEREAALIEAYLANRN